MRIKSQITNTKSQISTFCGIALNQHNKERENPSIKIQMTKTKTSIVWNLKFGAWNLFGAWCLVLGICIFLQSPVFGEADKADIARHYRLGRIYYENGLYEDAQREFKKAMNVPDNNMLNDSEQAQILPARDVVPPAASPAPAQQVKNIMPGTGTDGIDHKINKETPAPAVLVSQPDAVSPAGDYIIGPGDTLSVSVWENSDLDKEVIVRPDGKISFPLIDDAVAAGLAIPQLRGVITAKLSEFIRYPQVVVSLRAIGGNKIIVLGEVGHPGVFSLSEQKSVLEAVALAGGFTKDAVLDSVIVIKGGLKNPQAMRVNLTKALIRANMKENVLLVSQDIVYVPRRFIANLSYFLNQILDPISKGASIYQQFQTLGVTTTTTVTQ